MGRFWPSTARRSRKTSLESEFFGHEKGALHRAHVQRNGQFEAARAARSSWMRSANFLPRLQVKLLRFLQEQRINQVGEA